MMEQLGIFAKYWEPGQVKTRLAADLGTEQAAALYRQFLETSLGRFSNRPCHHLLAFTPTDRRDDFAKLAGPDWHLQSQATGDLGSRMKDFFDSAFAAGRSKVVLIGSDSPTLPVVRIDQAFEALETVSVVLGPSTDGGYYLVGAAGTTPDIFDRMHWSRPDLWQQTVERLQACSIPFVKLPPWYDVDDQDDLERLIGELADPTLKDLYLIRLRDRLATVHNGQDTNAQPSETLTK